MDETTTAKPQAGEAESPQPQAGTTPSEPQAGDESNETTLSLDEAKKLRSEASNLRKRLKDAEAQSQELKAFKKKIDTERLTAEEKQQLAHQKIEEQLREAAKERDAALQQVQSLRLNNEVFKHGQKLGIVDLDAAAKLLDAGAIEYGEDGAPANIEALLKSMIKDRPWLAGQRAPTSGGATNPPRSQSSGPEPLSWDVIAKMSQDEYRARRAEIQQWMSNNPMPR